ncbi:MAG: type 1 glutamine amidotransferase [Novosphingobium sp.]|nr:type 1 glutamine amidotransferase [Novosphingobium sp.]
MLDILIVEGSVGEALDAAKARGWQASHETYRDALALHRDEARFTTIHAYAPERDAPGIDYSSFDGIVLGGSGVAWSADDEEARPYLNLLEELFAVGKPVVGSCWGLQAVAVLLGGSVGINERGKEVGVARDITLTQAGRAHWGFAGLPERFDQPAIHRDHVTALPSKAVNLAGNNVSEVQAMSYETDGIDFIGYQFHPEFELGYIRQLHEARAPLPGEGIVLADFPDDPSPHVSVPKERTRVLGNWLDQVEKVKKAG